ncbi:MAG TPA: MarR family transcriptional regulator [Mycobacteriales bacterium]
MRTRDIAAVADDLLRLTRCVSRAKAQVLGDDEATRLMLLMPLRRQGPMRTGALAEAVHSDASTVSRQVAELVHDGLVERRADPADGRATVLALRAEAEPLVDEAFAHRDAHFAELFADWTTADIQQLRRLLARLADGVESHTMRGNA